MLFNFRRDTRTSSSEQYNIFCDEISDLVGTLDVHILNKSIVCRVILLQGIEQKYDIFSIKDSICDFLGDLSMSDNENKEIILDFLSGKEIAILSSVNNIAI